MISMPVIDRNSGVQNILSAKKSKGFESDAEQFGQIMQQSAVTEQKNREPVHETDKVETKETTSVSDTKTNAMREKVENNAQEEATETVSEIEKTEETTTEDLEQINQAAGYVMSELTQLLHVTSEALQEAMEDLGMTKAELLTPEGVKELVIQMTDGADGMSLLTDADLYQTVNQALEILDDVTAQLASELDMTPEDFQKVLDDLVNQTPEIVLNDAETVSEEEMVITPVVTEDVDNQESEVSGVETENLDAEKVSSKAVTEHPVEFERHTEQGQSEPQQQFMTFQNGQQTIHNVGQISNLETVPTFDVQTLEIMDQIMDFMKVEMQPEVTQLQMQLHPESLGTLSIQISSREGIMTAQFTTASEDVKAVLESQMVELKQNLEQQGVKVEAVEVTIAEYSLGRETGQEQGSERGQYEEQKKGRRSLRISDLELDELTEEEKVEVEMMKTEGSTVSYMA